MLVEGYIPEGSCGRRSSHRRPTECLGDFRYKPDPLEGPYFEETIYVTPSRLSESVQRAIEKCARDSARALGLSHGPIHAEFRITSKGVWPIEVGPGRSEVFAPDLSAFNF